MGVVEEDEEDRSQGSRKKSIHSSIQLPDRSEEDENEERLI